MIKEIVAAGLSAVQLSCLRGEYSQNRNPFCCKRRRIFGGDIPGADNNFTHPSFAHGLDDCVRSDGGVFTQDTRNYRIGNASYF